ncbi:MAG: amino acid lyase [Bryobacteraceae bacterium]|nr:amino acid lyase [Bryobacteraceae bacterium]
MRRRSFLAVSGSVPISAAGTSAAVSDTTGDPAGERIFAYGDGIPYTPAEYAALLSKVVRDSAVESDEYSRGGVVSKLETRMASLLGKEAAVWLPTGTLANHMAIRLHCGNRRRALVQAESHLYRDCGDCAQTLSGINLVPLASGKATVTVEEIEAAANESHLGRVDTPPGAIQIETPVRRRRGERANFGQMQRISTWARERQIGLHLDGARLFLESAYTGKQIKEYTALFDTAYVSLYKYLNAGSGAILAGPATLLKDLYHARRMFGGGLPQVWQYAAIALHTLEGFETRYRRAVETSEKVIARLAANPTFQIERVPDGTNVFLFRVFNVNPPVYQLRLETAGISARVPVNDVFLLQVNETWNRLPADDIYGRFIAALG